MDKVFFLLISVFNNSGDVWIPWYTASGGLTLLLLVTMGISLLFVALFYFVFPLIKPALTNVHFYLTMLLNAVVCFFSAFFILKSQLSKYIFNNALDSIDPMAINTISSGTMDMWLASANCAIFSLILFFVFAIIIKRWGPHGTNLIPFGK